MRALCVWVSFLLSVQVVVPPARAQNPPASIQIVIVEGEGAINNVGQRSSHDPVIRVQDEIEKPIAGAAVVFTLPTEGASGVFGNGEKTLIVTTDTRGQAAAVGLKVNDVPGRLPIHVNASYRGQTARANITQFSMAVPGKRAGGSGKTLAIVLAIVGAAAGGGAALALRNGNGGNPAAPPTPVVAPIGIAAGTGSVGPPR
jgi:hypothetical protein